MDLGQGDVPDNRSQFAYNMMHTKRGKFIIMNNETFRSLPARGGTDEDAIALKEKFTELGFAVTHYKNLSKSEMLKIMIEASKEDHTDFDCFGCAILTHGREDYVYGTDGEISIKNLTEPFKGDCCSSLAGKPKIFIIQACRGEETDDGTEVQGDDAQSDDASQKSGNIYRIPVEADFLYAYSTVPGYFAFRRDNQGSWFIQALAKQLGMYGQTKDFLWILTRVNHQVAYEYESRSTQNEKFNKKKQVPSIVSMLTKDLYFPAN